MENYNQYLESTRPKSKHLKNFIMAFIFGGAICVFGEYMYSLFANVLGADKAGNLATMILITLSGLFTGLGLYEKFAQFAGAGALVPITGFANAVVACALEYKVEGYTTGVAPNIFMVAGSVLVYGYFCSFVYGAILSLVGLL